MSRGHAVMTCHVLHAGDGYTYLTGQVASQDSERSPHDPLVDYYQATGNPPGQWVGAGCPDLDVTGEVSEEQMAALFGEGLRPDAGDFITDQLEAGLDHKRAYAAARLGRKFYGFRNDVPLLTEVRAAYERFETQHQRRATVQERREIKEEVAAVLLAASRPAQPRPTIEEVRRYITDELGRARQPVAGFDLVFSPVKSVSLLWALGGHEIRSIVEEVHEQAWRDALAYGEREGAYTRVGDGGIAFKQTSGFIATAFQHRDSRAGDPDLHTHVAVSNRVLADDGVWRTLDSRQLHKIAVSMSETYNSLVEQRMVERLGVRFVDVAKGAGKRVVREIEGIPEQWLRGFSRRRAQVEAGYDVLVRDYVARYGHTPPRSVQIRLAQQATLEHRPAKGALRTLAQQVADWTRHARELIPGVDIPAVMDRCLHQSAEPTAVVDIAETAAAVISTVAENRATWTVYHVRAEAQRQLRGTDFPGADERMAAVEAVTQRALGTESVLLDVEIDPPPLLLQQPDGASVFRRPGSERFTSEAILSAEQRMVDAAFGFEGPVVGRGERTAAVRRFQREHRKTLNAGQAALVEHFVSSGAALAAAIGPPGTGKSTAMRAVREAWDTTGGRVIGLAPSAAAASVLGDELGVRADTLHSLITQRRMGLPIDVQAGDMLLVDEAGMAGTLILDELRALAAERGAVVRLVGDYRQLTSVEAGGVLRLIHHDAGGIELTEVHRFKNADEAEAVLRFRVGDVRALDFYAGNDRVHGGARAAVLDRLYQDWTGDVGAGRVAIMISDSSEIARELSARAQTERRAAGLAESDGAHLHDGTIAGIGDRIVTRKNRRRLAVRGGRDYVKNGDLWEVDKRYADGRLRVRHIGHGGRVTLPAWYVAEWVELGYAATIHRSQGLTVDIVRAFLTNSAVREAALVALSRGRDANHAYLDTEQVLDPDEPETLPGDLYYRYRENAPAIEALAAILGREGAEPSAIETLRAAMDDLSRLSDLVPQYDYARHVLRGPFAGLQAEWWVRAALPGYAEEILNDEAWPELARILHEVRDAGVSPEAILADRAGERLLEDDPADPARSVAKVLHFRIVDDMPTANDRDRPVLLPGWIASPTLPREDPPGLIVGEEYDELADWVRHRAEHIADRVYDLGERAAATRPVWASALGDTPEDPIGREWWIHRAGQVAAFRERWQVPDTVTELLPGGRGQRDRARAWVLEYLAATASPPSGTARAVQSESDFARRARRLREQLAGFQDALNVTTTRGPGAPPVTGPHDSDRHDPGPEEELDHDPGPEL